MKAYYSWTESHKNVINARFLSQIVFREHCLIPCNTLSLNFDLQSKYMILVFYNSTSLLLPQYFTYVSNFSWAVNLQRKARWMDLRRRVEICASTQCEWLQIIVRVSKAVVVNTLFNMLIIFFKKIQTVRLKLPTNIFSVTSWLNKNVFHLNSPCFSLSHCFSKYF